MQPIPLGPVAIPLRMLWWLVSDQYEPRFNTRLDLRLAAFHQSAYGLRLKKDKSTNFAIDFGILWNLTVALSCRAYLHIDDVDIEKRTCEHISASLKRIAQSNSRYQNARTKGEALLRKLKDTWDRPEIREYFADVLAERRAKNSGTIYGRTVENAINWDKIRILTGEDHSEQPPAKKAKPTPNVQPAAITLQCAPKPSIRATEPEEPSTLTELRGWRARYRVISLVPDGFPFSSASAFPKLREEYNSTVVGEVAKAREEWDCGKSAEAWRAVFSDETAYSSSEEEDFELFKSGPTVVGSTPLNDEMRKVASALQKLAASALDDPDVASVVAISSRCYKMYCTGLLRNIFTTPSTQELEYRSCFWDRLFENTLATSWLQWTPGEIENTLIARTRATQAQMDTSVAMKHDGIGSIALCGRFVDVVFFECAGSPTDNDKKKVRDDTAKVFKAICVALDCQRQIAEGMGYSSDKLNKAFTRLGAFGIVAAQQSVRVYAGKWVDRSTVIDEVAVLSVPSQFSGWLQLGELVKECLLLRQRIGFLYHVLKAMYRKRPSIPAASFPVTPDKRIRST
ncbi:hypothetical protein BC832DRAFT_542307 [Gaertneriomyces semiglobifer]|nr:hypothetical protein BC832DRAFT_542307 [Gaertneriomyces semiglobifer]